MEDFLRKYKLIDNFTVELPVAKSDFVRQLRNSVDTGEIGLFSGAFEAWESSKNDYKGEVTNQGFKFRKRKKFFQTNGQIQAIATGTFKEDSDKLSIHTEVRSPISKMMPIFVLGAFVYLFAIITFVTINVASEEINLPYFALVFIVAHAALIFFIFFYISKRSVANLKRELEREFVFLANKS